MKALLVSAAAVGLLVSTPAFAQAGPTSSATANADAVIVQPISIQKITDLNFGRIAADTAASTVTVATDGTRTSSSPNVLIAAGSSPTAATFTVHGEPGLSYTAQFDSNPIALNGPAGSTAMSAQLFGIYYTPLDAAGNASVAVGGILNVGANQMAGPYHGTLQVNVQYN